MSTRIRGMKLGCLVFALVAAGCTGGGASSSDRGDSEIPAVDVNATTRDDLPDGGTLRWPIPEFSGQWNFFHFDGAKASTAAVIGAVMPQMWRYNDKAVPSPNPAYLSSAEMTATKPKQVVKYTLNPRARWSSGRDMTWREFEAQWKAMGGRDQRFQISASQGYNQIESVTRGDDDDQAIVTYSKPFGEWQAVFDPIYPESVTRDPNAFNKGWRSTIPITAGPFKFGGIDKAAKTVTVVRDSTWWGSQAKLDKIVFHALPGNAAINAFSGGKVDFLDVGTNTNAYERAKSTPGTSIRKAAAPDFTVITFNGTSPSLKDRRVRQAIALTIDRAAIASSALEGVEWPGVPLNNHFFVNTQEGYQNNSVGQGAVDKEAAGKLLDEAGWKLTGTRRAKAGQQLTLRYVMPSGSPRSRAVGEQIQEMLGEMGVRLELSSVPAADFFDDHITPGNFDLAPSAWQGTPFPVSAARAIYAMPTRSDNGELQIQQNFARMGNDRIDTAMDAAIAELDPDAARAKANEADKLIWGEVHSLTLYQQPQIRACKEKLANFGANGFRSINYEDIGFKK